jgi:hypothetical protein
MSRRNAVFIARRLIERAKGLPVVKQQVHGGTFNPLTAGRRPGRVSGLHAAIHEGYGPSARVGLPLSRKIA